MTPTRLGRYEITGTLGRGAMGVVYAARDPLIERSVAIKTVACAGLSGREAAEFEERFFREAKSAGRLNHPNIVTVHDVGREGELAWIAMELLAGRSLRDLLDAGEALSRGRIVGIVAAVADALAFAHARGIVHRDVKPANIMVLESGVVKLADFGIAQLPGSGLTTADSVLGSPRYMSPEQIAGQKADGRSDIFSLGVVLYELLTGQPAFEGNSLHATMYQVVHKEVPAPSLCRPGLSAAFDAIVAKAVAKDPLARYQDAAAMAAALRRALRSATAPLSGETKDRLAAPDVAGSAPASKGGDALPGNRWRKSMLIGAAALVGGLAVLLRPAPTPTPTPAPPTAVVQPRVQQPAAQPQPPLPAAETKGGSASEPPARVAPETLPTEKSPERPARKPAEKPGAKDAKKEAATVDAAVPARPPGWQSALGADLKACDAESVFRRIVCIEKARWKHCPGHWGEIADCPVNSASKGAPP